jgi:hypothetical protein
MTTILKAHRASDFLALVPFLVGFRPRNSVVLVAFRGNRTRAALRFDLPGTSSSAECRRIAATMIGMLCKLPGADAVVPVAYTDDAVSTGPDLPHAPIMTALMRAAERAGFRVRDALCVAADAWGSYLDADHPPLARSLDEIGASTIGEGIPAADRVALGAVDDGASLPAVDLATAERVARLLRRYRTGHRLSDFDAVRRVELSLGLTAETIEDRDAALLLLVLQAPAMRDAAMLQFAFGTRAGLAAVIGDRRRSAALLCGDGPRPDPDRIRRAIAVLKAVAARAPRSARPAPLCVLAWLHWALGRGSVAGLFVDRALAIDPTHSMAGLLRAMFDSGALPQWAFEDPSGPSAA